MAKSTKAVSFLDRGAAVARFDYALIPDVGARRFLEAAAKELRGAMVSLTEAMCAVGEKLIECRPKVPHSMWTMWIVSETGMSETWARGCMAMYARFGSMTAIFAELDFALHQPRSCVSRLLRTQPSRMSLIGCATARN